MTALRHRDRVRLDLLQARSSARACGIPSARVGQAVSDHVPGNGWTAREVWLALREALRNSAPMPYALLSMTRRVNDSVTIDECVRLADFAKDTYRGGIVDLPPPRFPENHRIDLASDGRTDLQGAMRSRVGGAT